MKTLVVSLLRMGDLLMLAPALRAYKREHPGTELHLLTHRLNQPVVEFINVVDKAFYLDRDLILESHQSPDRSAFEGHDRLADLVRRVNRHHYHLAVNLTPTMVSARVLSLVTADEKLGLQLDQKDRLIAQGAWFRFLDRYQGFDPRHLFHVTDFSTFALGLRRLESTDLRWIQSADATVLADHHDRTVISPWSSDKEKELPEDFWLSFIREQKARHPERAISVIAGPDRVETLRSFISALEGRRVDGLQVDGLVLSLSELTNYLSRQTCLIAVDSMVKHLASGVAIKIFEVACGPSNPWITGAYREGSLIAKITGESHDLPTILSDVYNQFLDSQWLNLRTLASECADLFSLSRVEGSPSGVYRLQPLTEDDPVRRIDQELSREAWRNELSRLAPQNQTQSRVPEALVKKLSDDYFSKERALDDLAQNLVKKIRSGEVDGLSGPIRKIEQDQGVQGLLVNSLVHHDTLDLYALRKLQESVNQLRRFQIAKMNLLRGLTCL
jgi:ADP-heptose:LPS heptosyltransferase